MLRTDRIRKELAGITPAESATADYEQGLYDQAHTAATYAELNHRATELLGLGETVVLDASWNSAELRQAALEVACKTRSHVVQLRCWAPETTTAHRLATRTGSISDATPEIARHMATGVHPWPEAHTVLTAGSEADSLAQALAYLG